jgi:hypothetical protein
MEWIKHVPPWVWVALVAGGTLAAREAAAAILRAIGPALVALAARTTATWDDEAAAIAKQAFDQAALAVESGDKTLALRLIQTGKKALERR